MATDAEVWTLQAFCEAQQPSDWSLLAPSSQSFLQQLNLSSVFPYCLNSTAFEIAGVPPQGPLQSYDHLESLWDVLVTIVAMGVPSLAAMGELWLRLFSSVLAPLGIAMCIADALSSFRGSPSSISQRQKQVLSIGCLVSVASSVVLLTDTLYILEFGPRYGATLLLTSVGLAVFIARKHRLYRTATGVLCLVLLVLYLIYDYETGQFNKFGHKEDVVTIEEGLYWDRSNRMAQSIVNHWPESTRTYSAQHGATPWMPTGDARTGLPFLLHKVTSPSWTRVWLPVEDGEVVALDVSFPSNGHSSRHPVYLLLHGLNGGSREAYVEDFANRRNAQGSTVIVLVARGLMDLPVRSFSLFHGARWTDAHEAAMAVKAAAVVHDQLVVGVGYSMGAIVLANYVARSGDKCALDAAVGISGGLDLRYQMDFERAQRLWQPMLTQELRNAFVVGKWGERVRQKLTKQEMKDMMRATHITEIDKTAVVAYNGFRDLNHYYSESSALGDIPIEQHNAPSRTTIGRIDNISIPFCAIHSMDDPLVTWRSVAANQGLMHPANLTKTGSGNLMLLLTKRGGHVGWPLGWNPSTNKWKWMNDAAASFAEAVDKARSEPQQETN